MGLLAEGVAGGLERGVIEVAAVGRQLHVDLDHFGRDVDAGQRRGDIIVKRVQLRRDGQRVRNEPRGRELDGQHARITVIPPFRLDIYELWFVNRTTKNDAVPILVSIGISDRLPAKRQKRKKN